jgi:predicted outer membrane protein
MKQLLILAAALLAPAFTALAETEALDDAKIAGIVAAVNQAELNTGDLAHLVSFHPNVRQFALGLFEAHAESDLRFDNWAKKKGIKPQSSSISDRLTAGEEKLLEKLKRQEGILFDLDYMNHEVDFHQQALDLWDGTLIPNAKDEELKNLLGLMRPTLVEHLERARLIKTSLGRKK